MQSLLDTHQHLIYRNLFDYSWTEEVPSLAEGDFTLDDYMLAIDHAGVNKSLIMETAVDDQYWKEETHHALKLANKPDNKIAGVVASCRPEESEKEFDMWLSEVEETKVVGFRRVLHVESDELALQKNFIKNISKLGGYNKTFDMCFLERQLPIAYQFAKECENTTLILDHCGIPDIQSGDFDFWKTNIEKLSKLPNVACKISGVIAYCPKDSITVDILKPYITHCMESFGPDRLVWGSDWPVCNLTSTLKCWISLFREILSRESTEIQGKVSFGNALKIYNIPD